MRTLITAVSAIIALLTMQIPEFLQQYQQRLGGSADELTIIVRQFDEDSRRSGYETKDILQRMRTNSERYIRDQAQRADDRISRLARLRQQQEVLTGNIGFASFFAFVTNYDRPIAQKTYDNFVPALAFTFSSILFGLVGFVISFASLALLAGMFGASLMPAKKT